MRYLLWILVGSCVSGCVGFIPGGPTEGASVATVLDALKKQLKDIKIYQYQRLQSPCSTDIKFVPHMATVVLKQTINTSAGVNASIPAAVVPVAPTFGATFTNVRTQAVTVVLDDLKALYKGDDKHPRKGDDKHPVPIPERKKVTEAVPVTQSGEQPTLDDLIVNFLEGAQSADHSRPCWGFGKDPSSKGGMKAQIDFQLTSKASGGIGLNFIFGKSEFSRSEDYTHSLIIDLKVEKADPQSPVEDKFLTGKIPGLKLPRDLPK
jgi:hypothetical protein